ncbi:phosphoenolpyruvate--protein phosphotransferase [Arenicella xantha]|uniref:Phosphoenolpyruvate-protein phosphotransferase n=1 Tax=Arenicella xantha TaxID=644221 RepID=A0A395JHN4_9GAMM|nr:phosphoenolpyruvate--protein phosphotransferase [Arenicella xantha]RBP49647.1 phosphoenolpyruvate--protein phosphotransferase [Arenicella xantha]
MLSLFGSGIGRGIAIGQAYVLKTADIEPTQINIEPNKVTQEVRRFRASVAAAEQQYKDLLKGLDKDAPKESAAFINAHMLMLRDPLLINESIKIIRQDLVNAEYALQQQSDNLINVFKQMEDPYLREKKSDVKHITDRLLRHLMGIVSHTLDEYNEEDLRGKIIVGKDLTPAETMYIRDRRIVAFVTDLGSQISHTAIVARGLKLPAVVGLHGSTKYINEDDLLIVDGLRGIILVNPSEQVLKEYRAKARRLRAREKELGNLIRRKTKTLDGERIHLLANIESAKELREVKRVNAEGVGLYRTEYLFMNRATAPTENEQFRDYKKIVTQIDRPVVIRTLDIGGDKQLAFNYPNKRSSESPLGLRAVRLCLNHVELFRPQLRAILRASAFGKLSILIPMVSNFDEINQVLTIIKQTKRELKSANIAFDPRVKIGGMIEVPAAAIMADIFAQKLDFLSIGTNDLIQYTLAIDRVDDAVNYLYDPTHPAVLQLIRTVIRAGEKANIPVSLCGEMAGNDRYTRLLLGLGLKNFSMDATYLLNVKEQVLSADTSKLRYLVGKVINADNTTEAREFLSKLNAV